MKFGVSIILYFIKLLSGYRKFWMGDLLVGRVHALFKECNFVKCV